VELDKSFELIFKLSGSPDVCDRAYVELAKIEYSSDIISLLIMNGVNTNAYKGIEYINPYSSFIEDKPTVGVISLYLVDTILRREMCEEELKKRGICNIAESKVVHPYLCAIILDSSCGAKAHIRGTLPSVRKKASLLYKEWWCINFDKPLDLVRATHPFDGTALRWM
jgi:hypothetical protein